MASAGAHVHANVPGAQIPAPAAGRLTASVVLDREEMASVVALLKEALAGASAAGAAAAQSAPASVLQSQPAAPSNMQEAIQSLHLGAPLASAQAAVVAPTQAVPSVLLPQAAPGAAPAMHAHSAGGVTATQAGVQQPQLQRQEAAHTRAYAPPPAPPPLPPASTIAQAPMAGSTWAKQPPPPASGAAPMAYVPGAVATRSGPPPMPPPPPPPRRKRWQCVYRSDGPDHNLDAVHSLAYCPQIDGLPGGDGHAGWLISSSRKLLNLWECNAGGGPDMPSFMLMHSQETDFVSTCLSTEPDLKVMFAGGARAVTPAGASPDVVTVHSLSADAGILAYKYAMRLPDPLAPLPGQTPTRTVQRKPTWPKLASLHALGRTLRGCCATALGPSVLVYETHVGMRASHDVERPRSQFVASASRANLTCLHASPTDGVLLCGAQDGEVSTWNVRDRLGAQQPVRRLAHASQSGPISALQAVSETETAVACASPGRVLFWDVRSPGAPRASLTPDGSALVCMKASPSGDAMAVVTAKGLYTVNLATAARASGPIEALPGALTLVAASGSAGGAGGAARSPHDVEWNWTTGELYAACHGGVVAVYKQQP